jgi:hypothetical protein
MTWRDVAPYTDEPRDRWLRVSWAARHYGVDRATVFGWAKDGTVEAKQSAAGNNWYVSELSLRAKLFGKDADVRAR